MLMISYNSSLKLNQIISTSCYILEYFCLRLKNQF